MISLFPYLLAIGADTTAHPTLEEALQAGRISWEACSRECRVQVRDLERGKTYTIRETPAATPLLIHLTRGGTP